MKPALTPTISLSFKKNKKPAQLQLETLLYPQKPRVSLFPFNSTQLKPKSAPQNCWQTKGRRRIAAGGRFWARVSPTTPLLISSLQVTFLKVWAKQRFPKCGNFASAAWNQLSLQPGHIYRGTFHVFELWIKPLTPSFEQEKSLFWGLNTSSPSRSARNKDFCLFSRPE